MNARKASLIALCVIAVVAITACATGQGTKKTGTGNPDLDGLLEQARQKQVKLALDTNFYNDDNTFSVIEKNGTYFLVLPLKDCFLDITCGPKCDHSVRTGHSGDHLWLYLQKKGIQYTLDGTNMNKTMISAIKGLTSKGIPVAYTAPANTASDTANAEKAANPDLDKLLEKAKKKEVQLTFYGDAYNEDNTFSVVKTRNGDYNLVLPKKDCFLDIKCNPDCDPSVTTGHSGDHLWNYLKKNKIPYAYDNKDWNKTMITVIEGLTSKGIPVTYAESDAN